MDQYQSTFLIVALFIAATLYAAREKGKVPQGDTVSAEQLRGYFDDPTFEVAESTRPQVESTRTQVETTRPRIEPTSISGQKYSPYQIAMWYLKAHESFRPYEYPDGEYNSKGFGLNLTPEQTKWATKILGFPARSRNWTYEEGQKLLRAYWSEKREKFLKDNAHLNEYQQTAILLHAYNTGKYYDIRGCCGRKIGCGRKAANIRKAHSERREFEWKLYNGLVTDAEIEALRRDAIRVEKKWKKS